MADRVKATVEFCIFVFKFIQVIQKNEKIIELETFGHPALQIRVIDARSKLDHCKNSSETGCLKMLFSIHKGLFIARNRCNDNSGGSNER